MDKQQLERYWEELHYALDREIVDVPPGTFKALRKDCRQLEKHLESCPGGDEAISIARDSVTLAVC
ncbi:hypothetical protein HN803_02890 [candidate division WWE3 bacterium]|jgi:hypothetical protein|nr:hypothetical protein [Candidatus Scalindua sp.]MBT7349718.1 hypothetical protein [candidate division WWE3 bacterium]